MKHLFLSLTVLAFSINSFAQVEFGGLIEQGLKQQTDTAVDIRNATKTAVNDDSFDEAPAADSVKSIPTGTSTATTTTNTSAVERNPAQEKDFHVHLQPTGRNVAARYFPPTPKVAHHSSKKSKKSHSTKLAKHTTKKSKRGHTKVASKSKKGKANRTTASVSKKKKKNTATY
ncbi:MAG: hypothetical protein ACXWQQ_07875 [Pseudobdellovibrio sp.]